MPRRRPVLPNAGAVACLALVAALAAGCGASDAVPVEGVGADDLTVADATACDRLRDALPQVVDGLRRRPVQPADAYAAAWGADPVVLRCGVGVPAGFDEYSSCQITNGVAWFIPDDQITGEPVEVVMTAVGHSPVVEVRLPAEHFPPANVMVDLAPAIKRTTDRTAACG